MEKKNGSYGYQPEGRQERGYQPIKPGNGHQPSQSPPTSPLPPSSGSSVQKK